MIFAHTYSTLGQLAQMATAPFWSLFYHIVHIKFKKIQNVKQQ